MKNLDWNDIMVIYNSNAATSVNSLEVANYYAAARGIPSGNIQGYDLGTDITIGTTDAARDAFRAGALTDIQAFMAANSITGIALSVGCPYKYLTDETVDNSDAGEVCKYYRSLSQIIANAEDILAGTSAEKGSGQINSDMVQTRGVYDVDNHTVQHTLVRNNAFVQVGTWTDITDNTYPIRFCGRLGQPYNTTLANEGVTTAKRCVDDAIWFEENGVMSEEPWLFGYSDRNIGYTMNQTNVYLAYKKLAPFVGQIHSYDGNHADAPNSKYAWKNHRWEQPEITIPDQVTWMFGGGPVIDVFGHIGVGFENSVGSNYLPSVNIRRGGLMFETTSSNPSKWCIEGGGCCAVCPDMEPCASGLPDPVLLVQSLARGKTVAEAALEAANTRSQLSTTVIGDPFYTPFINVANTYIGSIVTSK